MCMCECRALSVSLFLGPVSCMRTEASYLLGYSEPLCFSGPTPAQLRLRFGTPTGPKYCATHWNRAKLGHCVFNRGSYPHSLSFESLLDY